MKQARDVAAEIVAGGPPSIEFATRPALDERTLRWLWRWFGEQYGDGFALQYGDRPCRSWATTLGDLTPAHLRCGIEALERSRREFPPRPQAFRGICLDAYRHRLMHAEFQRDAAQLRLPDPDRERRRGVADRGLDSAFKVLGVPRGARVPTSSSGGGVPEGGT